MFEELAQSSTVAACDAVDKVVSLIDPSLDVKGIRLVHALDDRPKSLTMVPPSVETIRYNPFGLVVAKEP